MDAILQKLKTHTGTAATIPDDKVDGVCERILFRCVHALTKEDVEKIQSLDKIDTDGSKVQNYIKERVPNFELIVEEEITATSPQ